MNTLITAHTGADGTPDNTLAYVRYALSTAADAFEIDVRQTNDGLFLGHDAAGDDAPSLDAVFSLMEARPGIRVNCDLKEPGLEEAVCAAARSHGLGGRLILSGTVSAERYGACPLLRETAEVYLNIEEYVPDLYLSYREIPDFELQAAERILRPCKEHGISTVNIYQGLVTARLIETLAAQGVGLSVWTVNSPWELQWFLSKGVTNITTRTAAQALALREKQTM